MEKKEFIYEVDIINNEINLTIRPIGDTIISKKILSDIISKIIKSNSTLTVNGDETKLPDDFDYLQLIKNVNITISHN